LVRKLYVPFKVSITDPSDVESIIENHIRETNSYKSFVDPGKFAEAMGCFVDSPWEQIAAELEQDPKMLKQRVRAIYRWRNRIAHEADINPVFAGVELWPISKEDVVDAIDDLEKIGVASMKVMRGTSELSMADAHAPSGAHNPR